MNPQSRAARVAALQRELVEKQHELVGLLEEDDLVARAAFAAEVDVIAEASPTAPPRERRRRRRRRLVAHGTSEQDIQAARRAAKRAGMLSR
jgi:hypothetical protein